MRCPKCGTLTLHAAGEAALVRCPRCPAVWLARGESGHPAGNPARLPPVVSRGPLVIEGEAATSAAPFVRRFALPRYGLAVGALALMAAVVAVALLAPGVSALPEVARIEVGR